MTGGSGEFQLASQAFQDRRIPAAIELLRQAEGSGYDPDECASLRWQCWMLSGEFELAWRESDQIAARCGHDPHRFWDGQSFAGKRVIIRCLHGYGDAIQFIRYAPLVRREAARVTVQTPPELVSLFRGLKGVDEVISWSDEKSVQWDQQIEVMELPRAFRTTVATIPSCIPYLVIDPELRRRSCVPPSSDGKFRIALQWGASDWNLQRSIPLAQLLPLCLFPDVEYYTFQRGIPREELNEFRDAERIHDVAGNSPEILATAAALANIDLLITVDTMLAHLAGSLGKQVWLLLQWDCDWRWMFDRHDTPWYLTMRLFRQSARGDWSHPVQQIYEALLARRKEVNLSGSRHLE